MIKMTEEYFQNTQYHKILIDVLSQNEEFLLERTLQYAIDRGYSAYTSTLKEARRLSISGLSASIIDGLKRYDSVPELNPEEDFTKDPVAMFGIVEAQRHKERGVSLNMFLGLLKYYRQTYIESIRSEKLDPGVQNYGELFINRIFDRIEIGFCVEWSGSTRDRTIQEMQVNNRMMTNEKNKYLTIFESIPNPVIILNPGGKIDNMNLRAAKFFNETLVPGSQYYCMIRDRQLEAEQRFSGSEEPIDPSCYGGFYLSKFMPWLKDEIESFYQTDSEEKVFEKSVHHHENNFIFRVRFSKNLDISGKFDGSIIILEDITSLKNAIAEVKTLRGILPICSHCKKIRDDQGYWNRLEKYIHEHSEAEFSHGICQECAEKYYPDMDLYGDEGNQG